jgi:hypothetical protein
MDFFYKDNTKMYTIVTIKELACLFNPLYVQSLAYRYELTRISHFIKQIRSLSASSHDIAKDNIFRMGGNNLNIIVYKKKKINMCVQRAYNNCTKTHR